MSKVNLKWIKLWNISYQTTQFKTGKKLKIQKKKFESTQVNPLTLRSRASNWDNPTGKKVKEKKTQKNNSQ
jgi:hypothetical protein